MKNVFNITIENTKITKIVNFLPKIFFYINNKSGVYTNKYIFKNKFVDDYGK